MFEQEGIEYFNPDEAARRLMARNPGLPQPEANSLAWRVGCQLLERAIDKRYHFAFETTLGGDTIARLLMDALSTGVEVRMWYVGLSSPELHIARVRARVARGGHDIPPATIRDRYDRSRLNLIRLLPELTELRLYDNSANADPYSGVPPEPKLLLHMVRGRIQSASDPALTPDWARSILHEAQRVPRVSEDR
jgi:predicted ABC-type ATPase